MNCAEYEDYLKLLEENKRLQQALSMSQEYAQELLGANARLTERNSILNDEIECHVETILQYKEEKQKAEAENAKLRKVCNEIIRDYESNGNDYGACYHFVRQALAELSGNSGDLEGE